MVIGARQEPESLLRSQGKLSLLIVALLVGLVCGDCSC